MVRDSMGRRWCCSCGVGGIVVSKQFALSDAIHLRELILCSHGDCRKARSPTMACSGPQNAPADAADDVVYIHNKTVESDCVCRCLE